MMMFFLSCDDQLISDWQVPDFFEGELLWVKLYGGSDEDIAHSIIETNDGGYAVLGNTKSQDGDISGKKLIASKKKIKGNELCKSKVELKHFI